MTKWLLSLDVTSVMVFVIVGRSTHGSAESVGGILHTAVPFLAALIFAWMVVRAWNDPIGLRTGLAVVMGTVAVGILMRGLVFGDGTDPSFQLVTAAFLTLFMIGWRMLVLGFLTATRGRSHH